MLFIVMSTLLVAGMFILGVQSLVIQGTAAFYPQILIGAGLILLLICSVQNWHYRQAAQPDTELIGLFTGSVGVRSKFLMFCLIWVVYPLIMPFIGFVASSVLAFYASSLLFGTKRHVLTVLSIMVFVIVFAVLLKTVIYVPVPEAWPDKFINSVIYRF